MKLCRKVQALNALISTPRKKIVIVLIVATLSLVALFVAANVGAMIYLQAHPVPTAYDFLSSRPLAYGNAPYYSPAFVDEMSGNRPQWDLSPACSCFIPNDMTGRWYNVKHGFRQTTNQPVRPTCTIYLVGNSAVWGSFLPDDETIASYLQRLALPCQVVNVGMLGASTASNVARLKTLVLRPHDIVIFYAGLIDVENIYLTGKAVDKDASLCNHLPRRTSNLPIDQLLCQWQDRQIPRIANDAAHLSKATQDMVAAYQHNIQAARDYTQQHGALFYNFLQPYIWSQPLSPVEQSIIDTPFVYLPGLEHVMTYAWPFLEKADPATIDLAHVLDPLRSTGDVVYFDWGHVNNTANAFIASILWQTIRDY